MNNATLNVNAVPRTSEDGTSRRTQAFIPTEFSVGFYTCLSRTLDALNRQIADLLKHHGISEPQYNVLRILQVVPDAEVISCRGIADRLITRDPDLTRLLDRLERMGLIERKRATTDRRMVQVRIAAAGRNLMELLKAPMARLHARHAECLGVEGFESLVEKLDAIRLRAEKNAGLSRWQDSPFSTSAFQ